jgi:hypothetical protein
VEGGDDGEDRREKAVFKEQLVALSTEEGKQGAKRLDAFAARVETLVCFGINGRVQGVSRFPLIPPQDDKNCL